MHKVERKILIQGWKTASKPAALLAFLSRVWPVVVLFPAALHGHPFNDAYFNAEMQRYVRRIVDQSVMHNYARALELCLEIEQKYPEHPAGYFFRAAVLQSKMMDYENYDELETFFELSQKALRLSRRDMRKHSRNSWPYFFAGASLGYQAFYHFREKNYLQAFRDGWNSIQMLNLVVEYDPQNYDAYLGIGAFKYYRSKYSRFLKMIPFVKDERQIGIELIQKAIEHGKFAPVAAMNALIWIYIEEKRFAEAEALVDSALSLYPGSRFFLWGKAAAAYKRGALERAARAYQTILQSYESEEGPGSPYNEMVCHTMLADIYHKLKSPGRAAEHATRALTYRINPPLQKRARKFQKKAQQILKQLSGR